MIRQRLVAARCRETGALICQQFVTGVTPEPFAAQWIAAHGVERFDGRMEAPFWTVARGPLRLTTSGEWIDAPGFLNWTAEYIARVAFESFAGALAALTTAEAAEVSDAA